ncbi:MAG: NADH-quinone oxidoreductase subunit C [Bilifractor sp.]|jgi:ech hydrogenase subunit D
MTVIQSVQKYEDVSTRDLLITVMRLRQKNLRLVQICCAVVDNKYEIIYSFADDDTYELTNLRVMAGLNETIPSICDSYPYANFYENEMSELFGLSIELIDGDYHGKFYRIEADAPFLNKKAKEVKAVEAEEIRKAAEEAANMPKVSETEQPEVKVIRKEGGGE